MALWTVNADDDPEAGVCYTIEGDVPGLLVDGETLDLRAEKTRHTANAILKQAGIGRKI